MDLAGVRGVEPADRAKLRAAGIDTAEELAWIHDLADLSARTGIPPARLVALRSEAVRAVGRSVRPAPLAFRSALASVLHFSRTVRESLPLTRGRERRST